MKTVRAEKRWWLEFLALDKGNERRQRFADHEAAAFHYELARRNYPLDEFPSYLELRRGECDIVFFDFSRKFAGWKPPVAINYVGKSPFHDGYAIFPSIGWNLRASKNALLGQFWKMIEAERRSLGISESPPSKIGKGRKSRNAKNSARTKGAGQPWRWLELLDNPHGLDSNERSHLSQARKKCHALKEDFQQLWKSIERHRAFLKRYYSENPQSLQIDLEPMDLAIS